MKPILLVEDSVFDAEFTLQALNNCGYDNPVIHAKDGEEALNLLHSNLSIAEHAQIGLIILDLKLPKVDGFDLLKALKASPKLEDIPVLILTSSDLDSDRKRAEILGVTNYLTKPLNPAKLWASLEPMLEPLRLSLS